jgi:hypothetical protein
LFDRVDGILFSPGIRFSFVCIGKGKNMTRLTTVALLAGMLAMACQPEPDNLLLFDELVVSTNYDPSADFSAYTTYALPTDTLGFISNTNPNDTILVHGSRSSFPRPVLQQVEENMNSAGYTRVGKHEQPDIGVNVYVVQDLNLFQQVIYPNFYFPYYYGYSSFFYYPFVNTYAYNTGALVVEFVDLKHLTMDRKVRVIWNAYMGDVYSTVDLIQQTRDAIDQAFLQSPYLNKSNN